MHHDPSRLSGPDFIDEFADIEAGEGRFINATTWRERATEWREFTQTAAQMVADLQAKNAQLAARNAELLARTADMQQRIDTASRHLAHAAANDALARDAG